MIETLLLVPLTFWRESSSQSCKWIGEYNFILKKVFFLANFNDQWAGSFYFSELIGSIYYAKNEVDRLSFNMMSEHICIAKNGWNGFLYFSVGKEIGFLISPGSCVAILFFCKSSKIISNDRVEASNLLLCPYYMVIISYRMTKKTGAKRSQD